MHTEELNHGCHYMKYFPLFLTDFITAFYFVAILTQQSTSVYTNMHAFN